MNQTENDKILDPEICFAVEEHTRALVAKGCYRIWPASLGIVADRDDCIRAWAHMTIQGKIKTMAEIVKDGDLLWKGPLEDLGVALQRVDDNDVMTDIYAEATSTWIEVVDRSERALRWRIFENEGSERRTHSEGVD